MEKAEAINVYGWQIISSPSLIPKEVNAVCKANFENEKEKHTKIHKEYLKQEAKKLMTGNKDADEDIMAFFKAKEEMMKRVRG